MKYSMVRQFSNAAIDNAYTFIFKIVDFFKVLYEALWAFIEIWAAFLLIFYNIFMYFNYIILFLIDRGSEESAPMFRFRRESGTPLSAPKIRIPSGANPVPAAYGGAKSAIAAAGSALSSVPRAMPSLRSAPSGSGAKTNLIKTVLEFLSNFFIGLKNLLLTPFKALVRLFDRIKESREKEKGEERPKSLIDQYLKEYEQRKK